MTASSEPNGPIPTYRALIPSAPRRRPATVLQRSGLPAIAGWRALPAVSRTAGAIALGLVVEYALRGVANQALGRLLPTVRRSAPEITRTIVTEVVIIEHYRRRS